MSSPSSWLSGLIDALAVPSNTICALEWLNSLLWPGVMNHSFLKKLKLPLKQQKQEKRHKACLWKTVMAWIECHFWWRCRHEVNAKWSCNNQEKLATVSFILTGKIDFEEIHSMGWQLCNDFTKEKFQNFFFSCNQSSFLFETNFEKHNQTKRCLENYLETVLQEWVSDVLKSILSYQMVNIAEGNILYSSSIVIWYCPENGIGSLQPASFRSRVNCNSELWITLFF